VKRRKARKRGASINAKFAKALKVTPQRISQLVRLGMPTSSVRAAKAWLAKNVQRRTGAVGNATQLLRAAQASLAELQVAQRRGELMPFVDVQRFASEAVVAVTTQLEGLPGRLAGTLAGMTDPAKIGILLRDEIRRIRAGMAQALRNLVPPDGGPGGTAAD